MNMNCFSYTYYKTYTTKINTSNIFIINTYLHHIDMNTWQQNINKSLAIKRDDVKMHNALK